MVSPVKEKPWFSHPVAHWTFDGVGVNIIVNAFCVNILEYYLLLLGETTYHRFLCNTEELMGLCHIFIFYRRILTIE